MNIRTTIKKPAFILPVIIGILVGGGSAIFAYSAKGKEIYADIWQNIILAYLLVGSYLLITITTWRKSSKQTRALFLGVLSLVTLLAIFTTSINWQYLPWVRSSAMKTANEFMTDLRNADHDAAFAKLSPIVQEHLSDRDFNYPAAQPVSWQFEEINRHSVITGQATFSDGAQMPIEIRLEQLNHEWKIYGVKFGRLEDYRSDKPETMPRLGFMFCCDHSGLMDRILGRLNGE